MAFSLEIELPAMILVKIDGISHIKGLVIPRPLVVGVLFRVTGTPGNTLPL
jgi:hypothetical protein